MLGTVSSPGSGVRAVPLFRPLPEYPMLVPRLDSTNENLTGWPLSAAWKLVPKSTAKALPLASPRLSLTNLPVRPAENRSEKFCA
jgi:hypothetical protein